MQYNLNINVYGIITGNHPLTTEDASILQVFWYAFASSKFHKVQHQGKVYTWIAYDRIIKELPLLGKVKDDGTRTPPTKSTVYKKVNRLVNLGYLEKHDDNALMNQSFFCSTDRLDSLFSTKKHKEGTPSKKSDPYEKNHRVPHPKNQTPMKKIIGTPSKKSEGPYEKNHRYNSTNKHNTKSILYKDEFLEVFEVFKKYSGNEFFINEKLIADSDKYKVFLKFWQEYKEIITIDKLKDIIKYTCLQNFNTKNQDFSRPETFFIKRSFGISFDKYLTYQKNGHLSQQKAKTKETYEETKEMPLDAKNLKLYQSIQEKVNDPKFTTNVFYKVLNFDLYQIHRKKRTPREIIKCIKSAIADSTKAFNKNRSLADLIKDQLSIH